MDHLPNSLEQHKQYERTLQKSTAKKHFERTLWSLIELIRFYAFKYLKKYQTNNAKP